MKPITRFLTALSYVTIFPFGKEYSGLHPDPSQGVESSNAVGEGNAAGTTGDGTTGRTAGGKGAASDPESDANSGVSGRTETRNSEVFEPLAGLSKYLPAVGLVVGLSLSAIYLLAADILNASVFVIAAVIVVAWLVITGGLHFDGLMDSADGICSHRDRKRMLEIMQDSRVGNFGAMTGLCVLLLKFVTLTCLLMNHDSALVILLLVPAWARWCELYAIAVFPYARQEGKGKVWHDTTVIPRDLILGAITPILLTLALCLILGCTVPLVVTTFTCISGVLFSHWFQSHLGGQTGDTYGAVVELSETSALLLTALVAAFIGT